MAALSLKQFYHKYGTGVPNSWEQCEHIWNAATEYAVENCHSIQQLKAEIAALVNEFDSVAINHSQRVRDFTRKLRQLSAV